MRRHVARRLAGAVSFVSMAVAAAVAFAPAAAADGPILWYIENHGEGYDLQADYSATYQRMDGRDRNGSKEYKLSRVQPPADPNSCAYGDYQAPNYRRSVIKPIKPDGSNALDPTTHSFCSFYAPPISGGVISSTGYTTASALLTAIADDGRSYPLSPGARSSNDGAFHALAKASGGLAAPAEVTWVRSRLGDTGKCQIGGLCGVTNFSFSAAANPSDFMTVRWTDQGSWTDLVWKVDWSLPRRLDVAQALGAVDLEECTITGTPGDDVISGTDGDDIICGLGGDDVIDGKAGDDIIKGGPGDDIIEGGPGNDILGGGSGDDSIFGGTGDDELHGATGGDLLSGGSGTDHMAGGSGDDVMSSHKGDPIVVVQSNSDRNAVHDSTNITVVEDGDGDGLTATGSVRRAIAGML
jgi:Ca2+-binding RTX toxin-like protein